MNKNKRTCACLKFSEEVAAHQPRTRGNVRDSRYPVTHLVLGGPEVYCLATPPFLRLKVISGSKLPISFRFH